MATRLFTEEQRREARERSRKWREANRDRHREYSRMHQKLHPVLMRLRGAKSRAKKEGRLHPQADFNIIAAVAQLAHRIQLCVGVRMAVDHIIPHNRGGYHHHTNVQAIPYLLNAKKQDRTEPSWTTPWACTEATWLS